MKNLGPVVLAVCLIGLPTSVFAHKPHIDKPETKSAIERSVSETLDAAFRTKVNGPATASAEMILEEILMSEKLEIRHSGIDYIWQNYRWLELDTMRLVISRAVRRKPGEPFSQLLFVLELKLEPRDARIIAFQKAIVANDIETFRRASAMKHAILEGLDELRPLLIEYREHLSYRDKRDLSVEYINIALDLREGADDGEEAAILAVQRLAAMDDPEFRENMANNIDFRRTVQEIADSVCGVSTFDGRYSKGCDVFSGILQRQLNLATQHSKRIDETTRRWLVPLADACAPAWQKWNSIGARSDTPDKKMEMCVWKRSYDAESTTDSD